MGKERRLSPLNVVDSNFGNQSIRFITLTYLIDINFITLVKKKKFYVKEFWWIVFIFVPFNIT